MWRPLGELLLEKGLVTPDELDLALTEQADSGRLLGAILVERGYVSGPALAVALAEQYGVRLDTQRGFGTGLWAEIDRRHRVGRGRFEAEDNVVKLEPAAPRGEFTKLKLVESPQPATAHLLLVPTPARYVFVEREGAPPRVGEELGVPEANGRFVVARVGRSPFPAEPRPCAFLLSVD